jgi:glycosyltransferase involved in cell wall biosynthesis
MNIFLFTETKSGCYKWRGAIPAKYLRQRGHSVQVFADRPLEQHSAPDVVVFYRAHYIEAVKLVDWCRKHSIRVVFDTDDALDLVPPENLHHAELQPRLPVYKFLLEEADLVTTTTNTLADYLRNWNPNVSVIPNSVDPEEWNPMPRGGDVRVGWSGSPTHFADLVLALDAIRDLQKKNPFTFVLQGICTESSLEELHQVLLAKWGRAILQAPIGRVLTRLMDKLSGIKYEFHPGVPVAEHASTLCRLALNVGIAPLADTPFNRNKSCVKYYEYAMSGAVTVASHVLPYSTEVPITAKNKRESWTHRLEHVLSADRSALLREQQDWVLTHRNIETTVELWEQAFAGEAVRTQELAPALPA